MLPRKRNIPLLWTVALLSLVSRSEQHGDGAPPGACINQMPSHGGIQQQASLPPYVVVTSSSQVRQGDLLNITITSPGRLATPIGGFILQARNVQKPDTIVGAFVKLPDPLKAQIISCRGQNDTVTHTSPEDKHELTFQWKAPTDFLGGIEFRATVAQSYAMFWKDVKTAIVEVVTPDTEITSTVPSAPTTRPTLPPPVVMETKPKPATKSLDPIYQGCDDNKLCFGSPQNCIQTGDCMGIVTAFVAGDVYTFEIQGVGSPKYVAAGLSMDKNMGDDSAMECVQNNGRVSLYSSWTYPKEEPYVTRKDVPQDILELLSSSFIDGKLYCKFRRQTVSMVKGVSFDLASRKYNLIIVAGSSMKDEERVGFHDKVYEATGDPVSLASVGTAAGASKLLLKLHGCLMVIAWLGSSSIGIVLARYFRQTWVGKQLGGKDLWFAYHRILMVLTWLLSTTGFIIILVEVGGWTGTGDNPHAITGIITVILCFIQPIGAYFRPHPGTKKRPVFNWLHWLGGNSAHILGIATIFLAVYLQKAELPGWTVYILASFVAFHVVMHLILTFTLCVADGRISNGRVNSFPMKDMLGQTRQVTQVDRSQDTPYSGFRRVLLFVYAVVVALIVIAMVCLVALAPIQTTLSTVTDAITGAR